MMKTNIVVFTITLASILNCGCFAYESISNIRRCDESKDYKINLVESDVPSSASVKSGIPVSMFLKVNMSEPLPMDIKLAVQMTRTYYKNRKWVSTVLPCMEMLCPNCGSCTYDVCSILNNKRHSNYPMFANAFCSNLPVGQQCQCPIESGEHSIEYSVKLPGLMSFMLGNYGIKIRMYSQREPKEDLFCYLYDVLIEA